MLEIDPNAGRFEHKRAFDKIFVRDVSRELEILVRVAPQRARYLGNHVPKGCVIVEDVKDPEAQLKITAGLLIYRGLRANIDHHRRVEQIGGGEKAISFEWPATRNRIVSK